MGTDLWMEYFDWLCQQVTSPHTPNPGNYTHVLAQMHDTEFVPRVRFDENRVKDAMIFRGRFAKEDLGHPVGVLEMMVTLADRIEFEIMGGTADWDRTTDWFWGMMKSLGLLRMTDQNYDPDIAGRILKRFLHRRYSSDGAGGLFTVADPGVDMRERDIWKQAAAHLNEVLRDEGVLE